jgi:hypothetical protein
MIVNKQHRKYLLEIKPKPPTLKVELKIHKENEPITQYINVKISGTSKRSSLNVIKRVKKLCLLF